MKFLPAQYVLTCVILISGGILASNAADVLVPGTSVEIAGTHGKFDFITVDVAARRLLAAHTGNGSLDVIDADTHQVIKIVSTGAAQDCAVDVKSKRYLVSVSKPPQLAVVDSASLSVMTTIPMAGPADLLVSDGRGNAYVGHDDASNLWVVDTNETKVVTTVELPGDSPEGLGFDSQGMRLFQAMKTGSFVAVVDVATKKVIGKWPTAPASSPHGIAMVPEFHIILVSGGNGKLVMMSQKDGKVFASTDIPERVDQIAYDAELHRIYCASGTGKVAIVGVEKNKLTKLGVVSSNQGCHSIAVDAKTHTVWIAYAKGEASFVQPFTPAN